MFFSCRENIEYEKIAWKDGLKINLETGKLLDGKYKSITQEGETHIDYHVSTFEYKKGIPTGKSTYTFSDDPIHSGVYLYEKRFSAKISKLTNAIRTDIDLWEEGLPLLSIILIEPQKIDNNIIEQVVELVKKHLSHKYLFDALYVVSVNDGKRKGLYKIDFR